MCGEQVRLIRNHNAPVSDSFGAGGGEYRSYGGTDQAHLIRNPAASFSYGGGGGGGGGALAGDVGDSYAYTSFAASPGAAVDDSMALFRNGADHGNGAGGAGGGKKQRQFPSQAYTSAATLRHEDSDVPMTGSVDYLSVAAPPWRAPEGGGQPGVRTSVAASGPAAAVPPTRPMTPSRLGSSFGDTAANGPQAAPRAPQQMSVQARAEAAANHLRSKRILAGEAAEPAAPEQGDGGVGGGCALEGEFLGAFLAKKELPRSPSGGGAKNRRHLQQQQAPLPAAGGGAGAGKAAQRAPVPAKRT